MNFDTGFYNGLFVGVLFRDIITKLINYTKYLLNYQEKERNTINESLVNKKIVLLVKITDLDLFTEYFPVLRTKYRTQPTWDFCQDKNIIKIELSDSIPKSITVMDFLNSTDLDIPFFESFGELFVYITYLSGEKKFINVYKKNDTITPYDFVIKKTELSEKYKTIIGATYITENNKYFFITKYLKMFLNNKTTITPEQLILYNDNINTRDGRLQMINNKNITILFNNESI